MQNCIYMSIYTAIIASLLALNSCLLWGKMTMKPPSPVSFESNHPIPLAFWIASEYGANALHPRPSRKQRAAIALDQLIGID
jgi:hypothetical protein